MGMTNTTLPDNARLLITDFTITGSSSFTQANSSVEFTLLVKINQDTYAQFVRKGVKVSPLRWTWPIFTCCSTQT